MGISQKTLQRLKEVSLADVVQATGGLVKKAGREYQTHCLWHDDNRPSLNVVEDKGFFFCPVCHAKADAIDYVGQKFGLDWRDAVEKTADLCKVPVELDGVDPEVAARQRRERQEQLNKLLDEQAGYKANLNDERAGRIRQILIDRGLSRETCIEFGIGFSPEGFFANRITVPIFNHRNELVGFTGRITTDDNPKYKNSYESDLFLKKNLVFNEVRAKLAAREANSLIFVEGHLDVVMMWQYGIKNVVALQGTGAPELSVLKRLAKAANNFVLCFDGDEGGRKAAEQFVGAAGPLAMAGEISINVAKLPEKSDPDEVLRGGGNLYHFIASAPNWLDWVIDEWVAGLDKSDTSAVTAVEEKLKQLINGLRSNALRTHYIDRAARILSKNEKEAQKIAKGWSSGFQQPPRIDWKPRTATETRTAAEKRMLRIFIHKPELRGRLTRFLPAVHNPALRWLVLRLQELQEVSSTDLTPHSVMAVVCVAEPHYLQQLRSVVCPTIRLDDSEGVLKHIEKILGAEMIAADLLKDSDS
jgi:DNA primase